MKKITIVFIIIAFFIIFIPISNAAVDNAVDDAISHAKSFFGEGVTIPKQLGFLATVFDFSKDIIKNINRILLIVLSGLSIISLAVVGIRFILGGASPAQQQIAKSSLKTVFIGMAYGFGAYFIWRITMGIVRLVLST